MTEITKKENTKTISKNFSKTFDLEKISNSVNSLEQAKKADVPTLNSLRRIDEEKAVKLIALYIATLNEEINIADTMSEKSINITAIRIIQKYGYLKLSDIIFVFNKIMDGEIKLYGSLSRREIMGALHDHDKLRSMR
jgi:hypothetical protein